MQMKRILSWLLILVMCFALAGCGERETPVITTVPSSTATPLLYRVTDANGNVAWLFGSIHVGEEDFYPLPAYVRDAFNGSDMLAVEVDVLALEALEETDPKLIQVMRHVIYENGDTIRDHISRQLYERAVAAMTELGCYAPEMDLFCPAYWSVVIESALVEKMGMETDLGVDRHLLKQAKSNNKPVDEVEYAAAQHMMLSRFSDDLQAMLLESSLELYENQALGKVQLITLMSLWTDGDEESFVAYLNAEDTTLDQREKKWMEEYNKAMYTDRNNKMAQYAKDALASGKEVFICVGAAHVLGDGAMVELLTRAGYSVERVSG